MLIDVQFNSATTPWPALRDSVAAAAEAGFGAVWVLDHLAGLSVNGTSMLEAFTLLGALAASTERIALGTLVLNVFTRQPAIAAVGAASVQAIAGRRVMLGLGAGSSPDSPWSAEMRAVGQAIEPSLARRHARVEETIALCRRMWDPQRPADLATMPLPDPPPELHVGASSVTLATLAGRVADGLNVAWAHPRRDELLGAARDARSARAAGLADLVVSAYAPWRDALLDPDDPERTAMDELVVDRLVLIVRHPDPVRLAATPPH